MYKQSIVVMIIFCSNLAVWCSYRCVLTPGDPYMPLPNDEIIKRVSKQVGVSWQFLGSSEKLCSSRISSFPQPVNSLASQCLSCSHGLSDALRVT